uniref:Uncharacterized protein n=1 Tax=Cucumis melo TaxID=3656 RepID=A0A9I9DCR9_CUCME
MLGWREDDRKPTVDDKMNGRCTKTETSGLACNDIRRLPLGDGKCSGGGAVSGN